MRGLVECRAVVIIKAARGGAELHQAFLSSYVEVKNVAFIAMSNRRVVTTLLVEIVRGRKIEVRQQVQQNAISSICTIS